MATERMTADEFKALKRRPKYRNKPTTVNGHRFDSKHEAARYAVLTLLQKAGKFRDLECQVRYTFEINGVVIGHYTADFRYVDCETEKVVVEDAKSPATKNETSYRLRKKLMLACFGVEVREV